MVVSGSDKRVDSVGGSSPSPSPGFLERLVASVTPFILGSSFEITPRPSFINDLPVSHGN
jgi:hypothetical protein